MRRVSRRVTGWYAVPTALAAFGLGLVAAAAAQAGPVELPQRVVTASSGTLPTGDRLPLDDQRHGVVYRALQHGSGKCAGMLQTATAAGIVCTHGPDSAPAGVDVTKHRSATDFAASIVNNNPTPTTSTAVPCYGDGNSGDRVQVIYAHAADVADGYANFASLIPNWVGAADAVFADSAAETGGLRHVRWVTDSACNVAVARVQLSSTGDDSLANTISELKSLGYTRADRKYLVLVDANLYCGISGIVNDDSASASNGNNVGPSYSRVDNGCWGSGNPVEAHELVHALGGVQLSAPHSSGHWHCTDEYDRMCYSDASGVTMTYPCASSHERLFDCGHDDYYSTNPAAASYLATHWNVANSAFLSAATPDAWSNTGGASTASPSPSPSATLTVSPSPSPSPSTTSSSTSTTTFSGSLTRKNPTRTFKVSTGTGRMTLTLTFGKTSSQTVTVSGSSGTVASASGPSPVDTTVSVANGSYTLTVSGGYSAFTLALSYPAL